MAFLYVLSAFKGMLTLSIHSSANKADAVYYGSVM